MHTRWLAGRAFTAVGGLLVMAGVFAGTGSAAASAASCQAWTGAQPPSPGTREDFLSGVAVLSPCDVWAAGFDLSGGAYQTLIEHWNGFSWAQVDSPDPGSGNNFFNSVRAASASSVWAVGSASDGTSSKTLIEHWNGTVWNTVPSPSPGNAFNELYGVRVVSANDAWAVGDYADGGTCRKTLVLHWNGATWQQVASLDPGGTGNDNDLFAVAATSHSDAWAVGEIITSTGIQTLTLHWNGAAWQQVASPNPGQRVSCSGWAQPRRRTHGRLAKLRPGRPSRPLSCTGTAATGPGWPAPTPAARRKTTSSTGLPPPPPAAPGRSAATRPAPGRATSSCTGTAAHGPRWPPPARGPATACPVWRPPPPATPGPLASSKPAAQSRPSPCTAADRARAPAPPAWMRLNPDLEGPAMTHSPSRARLARVAAALAAPLMMTSVLAGLGPAAAAAACQNWTGTQPPSPGAASNELFGVAVLSACDAWAVGDDVTSNGGRQTLAEHWNGSSWAVLPSPDPGTPDNVLTSVRAVSATNVWAVGYTGGAGNQTLVLHWDGTSWTQVPSPSPGGTGSDSDLFSVAATSHSDAWAVGEVFTSGKITTLIVHWNGSRWATVSSPNPGQSNELFGIAATSSSNAWAVGDATNGAADQTLVLQWNGSRWAQVPSPDQGGSTNGNVLVAVTATATRNAWAVGNFANGTGNSTLILHWNGTKWAHVGSPNLGATNVLLGVAASSAGNAWAVGSFRTSDPSQALALHCC